MRSSSSSTTGLRWSYLQGHKPHGVVTTLLLEEQPLPLVPASRDTHRFARHVWYFLPRHWKHACGVPRRIDIGVGASDRRFRRRCTLSDGAASPSDSASSLGRAGSYSPKRDPSASKHRSVDVDKSSSASQSHPFRRRTSRSTGPAKILIIITSAGFVGDESAVNAALDTWGQPDG